MKNIKFKKVTTDYRINGPLIMNKNYWIEIVLDTKVFHLCMLCTHWIHQPIPKLRILNFPYILDFIYGWYWNTNLNSIFLFGCHRSTKKSLNQSWLLEKTKFLCKVLTSYKKFSIFNLSKKKTLVHVDICLTTYLPYVDNRGHLTDHLPTSSCPRSLWMTPKIKKF